MSRNKNVKHQHYRAFSRTAQDWKIFLKKNFSASSSSIFTYVDRFAAAIVAIAVNIVAANFQVLLSLRLNLNYFYNFF